MKTTERGNVETVTVIVAYFSQPAMLARQLQEWERYPPSVRIILVDDGSPVPALPVVEQYATRHFIPRLRVYRILEDIPWARSTARNLAMQEAETPWCVVLDLDHVFPVTSAERLLAFTPTPGQWYRFPRWRRGRADDTRNKDALPRECDYGRIHEHMDSYLIEKALYCLAGGYNELVFNGGIGGGSEFLHRLARCAPAALLPDDIFLEVYTKDVIPDASVTGLSRDTSEYSRRRKALEASGKTRPEKILCLPWERIL